MCPADTSPEAWKVFLEIPRRLSPAEKLHRALGALGAGPGAAEAGLRGLYPLASEHEIFLRTARLALGEELFQQAYANAIPPDGPAFRRP
jgi:hypothetical protein